MSIQQVYLEQGSREWHDHRLAHFNASEAGAVMGVGKFRPRNMAELLAVKRGDLVIPQTPAMSRGNDLEPIARDAVADQTGVVWTPAVLVRGRYSASLDGLDFDGRHALEIKCPMSAESPLFSIKNTAGLREIAPHYWWQIVHQAWVSGVESVLFAVYHPSRSVHIGEISRDEMVADFDALLAAWEVFGKHLDEGTSPEIERTDAEWQQAAEGYRMAKAAVEAAEANLEAAKSTLVALGGGKGAGISVVRVKGRTTTDYSKALKEFAPDADLSKFTKTGAPTWRVQEIKQ